MLSLVFFFLSSRQERKICALSSFVAAKRAYSVSLPQMSTNANYHWDLPRCAREGARALCCVEAPFVSVESFWSRLGGPLFPHPHQKQNKEKVLKKKLIRTINVIIRSWFSCTVALRKLWSARDPPSPATSSLYVVWLPCGLVLFLKRKEKTRKGRVMMMHACCAAEREEQTRVGERFTHIFQAQTTKEREEGPGVKRE